MSRSEDKASKTEKPTPRRRREAKREGQVARSPEVPVALALIVALVVLQAFMPAGLATYRDQAAMLLANAGSGELPVALLRSSTLTMATAVVVPFLVGAVLAALIGGVAQVGFMTAPKAAKPDLKRLNPKRGLQRFKPSKMAWEIMRASVKLGLLAALLWQPLQAMLSRLGERRSLGDGLAETVSHAINIVWRAAALAVVIAAADFAWNRWRHEKDLRMSRHEVKRERKDEEGDPLVKAQRRRRATEMSRNRMLGEVTEADVVVTNPIHLAVALRYEAGEPAPRVVGKGANRSAEQIKALAYRHGVPVTEDRALARALYRRCKLGQYVPAALFEAVAVVLAMAYRRRRRRPAAASAGLGVAARTQGAA